MVDVQQVRGAQMPTEIAVATLLDLDGNELCTGRIALETADQSWRGRFTSYSGALRRFSVGPGPYMLRVEDSLYRVVLSRPFSYRPSPTIGPPEIAFSSIEDPPTTE